MSFHVMPLLCILLILVYHDTTHACARFTRHCSAYIHIDSLSVLQQFAKYRNIYDQLATKTIISKRKVN